MASSLSAPVGDPKSKSVKPANKPKDVELLQLALLANGYPVEIDGRMSQGVVTCIESFQRHKAKLKPTTGVIEPGDRVWKLLQPRLSAYEKEIASFEAYHVIENGKPKQITVQDWMRLEQEARARMLERARAMTTEADNISKCIREMHKAADGSEGYVNALVSLGVRMGKGIDIPSERAALDARGAAQQLVSLVDRTKPDWEKVEAQHRKASQAINKAVKEWQAFDRKYIEGAESGLLGATVTRDVSFGVLEVLATGYLITTKRMPPAQAAAVAAAGCEALKTGAGEIGEYTANDTFDPKASARKIVANSLLAGGAGFVGGKLTGPALQKVTNKLGEKFAMKVSKTAANYVFKYVDKVLESKLGEELIKNATAEAIKLLQKPLGEGKAPGADDVINAVLGAVSGGFLASKPVKSLTQFDQNWPKHALMDLIEVERGPALKAIQSQMVRHFPNDAVDTLLSKAGRDILNEVAGKMRDEATKVGLQHALSSATGLEATAAEFRARAMAALRDDRTLGAAFEAEAVLAARKRLEAMQKSKR
ncbi:MAG: hypothetical protein KF887_16505 [Paracoccaceae bacterium]|nr:MAG: hypothetical protein KF887_16505 [Paracoccaceae bacterium]